MTQPTELGTLLSAAERATFHGAPVAALAPLAEAIATARAQGRTAEAMAAGWLLGTTQSALGRYAEAPGSASRAVATLRRAVTLAAAAGVLPLVWPANSALAVATGDGGAGGARRRLRRPSPPSPRACRRRCGSRGCVTPAW